MSTLTAVLSTARDLGFLGPGPVDGQIQHAAALAAIVRSALLPGSVDMGGELPPAPKLPVGGPEILDLGSGGGIPGLVVAVQWPEVRMVLLDAGSRRTAFLRTAVDELGLASRCEVVEGRAEEIGREAGHRERYDAVIARSFGPPPVTAECASPLIRVGGVLVTAEPPDNSDRWPTEALATLGFGAAQPVRTSFTFSVVPKVSACPERFPRRTGVPAKRPLF